MPEFSSSSLDFLKSPSSCLFSTRRTKDFSYLIGANFSDPKMGRCTLTNQRSPKYPLGTDLSNYAQPNVTCGLCRALAVDEDHQTLRTALVCSCKFLRQYMYFLRTLSRLSWLQWTLDDAKVSLTSRIFRTMVSFLSAQFRHKMFVKSEPSPPRWIYISFPVINIQDSNRLWSFFWPPDIVNFRLKSWLVIILV